MLVAEKQFGITGISFSVYYKEVRKLLQTSMLILLLTYCFMDFIHGYMVRDNDYLYHA